jgi:hypothetical protein
MIVLFHIETHKKAGFPQAEASNISIKDRNDGLSGYLNFFDFEIPTVKKMKGFTPVL